MVYTPPYYPSSIPSQTGTAPDVPDRTDEIDWIYAARYNELKKELCAVMTELGTLPKGNYADVKTRLGDLPFQSRVYAYRGGAPQSISDITWTKVTLAGEYFDGLNEFDKTTEYRFTASAAGYYLTIAQVEFLASVDQQTYTLAVYKNGLLILLSRKQASGTGSNVVNLSNVLSLAANDYLEMWVLHNHGSAVSLNNDGRYSFFTVHRLS